jgi:hypothetical protein
MDDRQRDLAAGETETGVWPYLGVGCMSAIAGAMAFGMIAVLIAKGVSSATSCVNAADPRAPCNWLTYWLRGAVIGLVFVPTYVIWRMRKVRSAPTNSDRGHRSGTG